MSDYSDSTYDTSSSDTASYTPTYETTGYETTGYETTGYVETGSSTYDSTAWSDVSAVSQDYYDTYAAETGVANSYYEMSTQAWLEGDYSLAYDLNQQSLDWGAQADGSWDASNGVWTSMAETTTVTSYEQVYDTSGYDASGYATAPAVDTSWSAAAPAVDTSWSAAAPAPAVDTSWSAASTDTATDSAV